MTPPLRDQRSNVRGQRTASAPVEPAARGQGGGGTDDGIEDQEEPGNAGSSLANQQSAISNQRRPPHWWRGQALRFGHGRGADRSRYIDRLYWQQRSERSGTDKQPQSKVP